MRLLRPLLSLACFFFLSLSVNATHIIGGEIYYESLGGGEYEITLIVYRDCGPTNTFNTGFDDLASVGIYEDGVLYSNLSMLLTNAEVTEIPISVGNPCFAVPPELCVEQAIYKENVTLEQSIEGYDIVYQRCCRNPSIVNIELPDDSGATFWTQVPSTELTPSPNSSPQFNSLPPVAICANIPFTFDHSATDIEGDSLAYSFCTPMLGGTPDFPQPNPPNPPPYTPITWSAGFSQDYPIASDPAFEIDPVTGIISGTPNLPGQYVVGVCVQEYRNGVLISNTNRDFQFNVTPCFQANVASIGDVEPCQGISIDFDNNSAGAETYFWDFGVDGIVSDTSDVFAPQFTYQDTGVYVVTLIANPGFECADTTEITVLAYEPIDVDFTYAESYCLNGGRGFDFDGTGDYSDNATFTWVFENGTPSTAEGQIQEIFFDQAGTNTVTYTIEDHNCVFSYSEDIVVDPAPLALIGEQVDFCGGLTVNMTNESLNADSYLWDLGSGLADAQTSEENPSYTYLEYDTYVVSLTVSDESGCTSTALTEVVVIPQDPITLEYDVIAPVPCDSTAQVLLQFTGSGADVVTWDLGDGTTLEGFFQNYEYEEQDDYTITVTAFHELCELEETEQVDIVYDLTVIDQPIIIPNVFSPNRDGSNDFYRLFYEGGVNIDLPPGRNIFDYLNDYSMQIFDRWGNNVFDTETDGNMWDGTRKGTQLAEGTYYYIINYRRKCLDTEITNATGTIELTR